MATAHSTLFIHMEFALIFVSLNFIASDFMKLQFEMCTNLGRTGGWGWERAGMELVLQIVRVKV